MDLFELSGRVNQILMKAVNGKFKAHEVDFSKFDKSQEEICLKFLCKVLKEFNVPDHFIKYWLDCHTLNNLVFHKYGINVKT